MESNFSFLKEDFPALEKLGSLAENYLYSDPNACLLKMGMFAESVVNYIFEIEGLSLQEELENTAANKIKKLNQEGLIPKEIDNILYTLRKKRNLAIHEGYDSPDDCFPLLQMTYKLGVWFFQTYDSLDYKPVDFFTPQDNRESQDYDVLLKENERLATELESLKSPESVVQAAASVTKDERRKRSSTIASNMKMLEEETRYLIDEKLRAVGWEADTVNLRFANGTRPQKGKNIAIAEWPTISKDGTRGYVDYALFVGLKMIGVVEAKRTFTDVSSVIDNQCRTYAMSMTFENDDSQMGMWGEYRVPFVFATNGRPYLKQLETKSGIWFRDVRLDSNIPKALHNWMSPDGMMELFEKDVVESNKTLQEMPFDFLTDHNGLGLRPYQLRAIEAAENAVIDGKQGVLISMATGTGKTRTVSGLIYRFLKSGRFNRVLFLVDRNALGEQAIDMFSDTKIEDLMTLNQIYDIKKLDDKEFDKETKIHVATVQSLVKRILYNDGETVPAVTDYDLIVVDEAHRGYILDRELGDDEFLYRDQNDYISKYRMVIEYFDAVKVALTATPAIHTTQIFGKPVFTYSYREAVIEGYLSDHNPPHRIVSKLKLEGINFKPGETVPIYNPITNEILNSDELEDELNFEIDNFNRQVITENFNRTNLEEIAKDLNPEGDGKTLIYAVDDNHADLIVRILKEIYEPMGVSNDAIMKITGSIGNKKNILGAVKRFKNEKYPNIAVTVDLLTTGIDVPKITSLVFMRRVKSRILFEQMMGRATRLCPEIQKTHFDIYDPVGVYESLDKVSTMLPVVSNVSTTFEDLLDGLSTFDSDAQIQNQLDMIVAKMQRQKRRMSDEAEESFEDLSGGLSVSQFIEEIRHMAPSKAKDYVLQNPQLFDLFNEKRPPRMLVISNQPDEIISHERGYGVGVLKPEDYLSEFNRFINENMDKIAGLNIVCTRPKELTLESLKSLRNEMARQGFTEQYLNMAVKEIRNVDVAADLITFIRNEALGVPLTSHEERVKFATNKVREKHHFNKMQSDWFNRIEMAVMNESVADPDIFERGAFKTGGGFNKINRIFDNQLEKIMQDLNYYLYE
ncbi:hypothetical protein MsAg5_14230 [Methanosarcinaceae archaeon Ag5]|uniref:Uncharacterized protein n=1 Tax=Methanolapillus africanus TaxID=3028297 RepID=A0AAE4MKW8_9EURY|nr:hypothetical protein [Methanosarcinaceae archaeon Ag5]